MPIRNPFRKAPGGVELQEENQRPGADRGFQQTPVNGTKPVEIKEPTEYKLSEINDSGVYLPPSPPEKPSFWHSKSNASTTSSNHRSMLSETEPFSISRESFDSYRRSFDISARSPIPDCTGEGRLRQSLDSRRNQYIPRSSFQDRRIDCPDATAEEGFEEVGLNDEPKPVKKRGLFARFGDNSDATVNTSNERPASSHHSFHFTGRKRGQSGQGAELRSMGDKLPSVRTDVPVEAR
ncbi:hypothetical protein BU16DRAFT_526866 [Lophium mytilinum]|uniref:Pal1-domain-containing protein n=1 Tax=Lophium mytilinum TaxID=390894 RepID=A0A6A6QW05_9PEZI|nr:hypothetical protein BU16DRAFT_526866 [Lophium mytilinum]